MRIPKIKNRVAALIASGIVGVVLTLLFIAVVHILSGGPQIEPGNFDKSLSVVHPSVAKAAALSASFWTYLFTWFGASILAFSFIGDKTGTSFGTNSNNEKVITIVEFLGGIALMCFIYLSPAYRLQRYTTITVPAVEAESVKNRDFKEPFTDQNYELYLKAYGIEPK